MNKIFIICGPTGVGKTTIAKNLFKLFPSLKPSVTYTTRPPRPSAIEDKKMIHISEQEFNKKITEDEFLEHAIVHNHYYGTAKKETLNLLKDYPVLCNVDVRGAEQIQKKFPEQCITIFIAPESTEQLIKHVKNRGPITEAELQTRLETAKFELSKKNSFTHQLINKENKLNETITEIANIIKYNLSSSVDSIE